MMICSKLPTTEKEVVTQLRKNKIRGLKSTVLFLTGVIEQKRWNEQATPNGYSKKMKPIFIRVLNKINTAEKNRG